MNHKKHTYYRGEYRHINYEIWNSGDMWAGYVVIPSQQLDCELIPTIYNRNNGDVAYYEVSNNRVLRFVHGVVNGGVTFTTKDCQSDLQDRHIVKIGWDYGHGFNDRMDITVDMVYADCVKAIDALWNAYPSIKVHCSTIGGYHLLSDGIVKDGNFISYAGIEWRKDQGWSIEMYAEDLKENKE